MLRTTRCARCGNRLRIRSRRCRHCGAPDEGRKGAAEGSRVARFAWAVGIVVALLAMLFVGRRVIEPGAVADWYAEMAIQHLPRQFSAFAPAESPRGAFYFCIRRVVKDHMDPNSVATFPGNDVANTVALGAGRYRVGTHVVENTEAGEEVRREFTCVTTYDRGRWTLDELSVESYAQASNRAVVTR
jgi:hypothetical protein